MKTHSSLGIAIASEAIGLHASNRSFNELMECERWLKARIDALRMRSVFDQQNEVTSKELPEKVSKQLMYFNPEETNIRGETLITATIKYVTDRATQIRYINMLTRSGCDPSRPELRQQRTPLMLACLMRNDTIAQLLIQLNVNLTASDRLGNTALMYAAIYGQVSVVAMLVNELTRRWSFDVFRAKNLMGYTAEALAKKNGRYECSRLLKRERLHMLQRMHRQLALIHLSASLKGWNNYGTVYKAKQAFLSVKNSSCTKKPTIVAGAGCTGLAPIFAKDSRSGRNNSDSSLDSVRKYRSIGEGDFRELVHTSLHLPPIKGCVGSELHPMKKIGGSVEFPSITSISSR